MTTPPTNLEMHADHGHWQSQIAMWKFDLQQWESEHKKALAELEQIVGLIRQHADATASHKKAIDSLADDIKQRESDLAANLEVASGSDPSLRAAAHSERAKAIETLRRAHERMKKHHHTAISHVSSLKASLEAAM